MEPAPHLFGNTENAKARQEELGVWEDPANDLAGIEDAERRRAITAARGEMLHARTIIPDDRLEGLLTGTGAGISPGLKKLVDSQATGQVIRDWIIRNRPLRTFVPNWGQEKAFLPFKDYGGEYPNSDKPEIVVFTGGNGVGKTTMMVAVAAGMIWGNTELHSFFDGWKIFREMEDIRREERRPLKGRIVCDKGGMETGGAILDAILKWWPKGLYKLEKNHNSYFSQIECYRYNEDGEKEVCAQIQVKTFHQDPGAHAGSTLDFILSDEPMPRELYAETIGRLRTKGKGFLAMFCTPLEVGGWIRDYLAKEADGKRIVFTSATIWDNCSDWHPDPAVRGNTRGTMSRSTIQFMIREWRKDGPEIADARENGTFIHLAGAVYKEFNFEKHVVPAFVPPKEWPIYCVMDPHDAKPSFVGWYTVSPDMRMFWIAEYPLDSEWERVSGGGSVANTCVAIRNIERYFLKQVMYRIADPVKILMQYSNTGMNLQAEYAKMGYRFSLGDNSGEVGTSRVREMLAWDTNPDRANDPMNVPRMVFMDTNPWTGSPNRNLTMGMSNLVYKKRASTSDSTKAFNSLVADTWKDPCDVIRYGVMGLRPWRAVGSMMTLVDQIRDGRMFIRRSARPW